MSKLRDEEKRKKKLNEELYTIEQIGKEGKKGIKYFKEQMKIDEKKQSDKISKELEQAEKKRKSKIKYNQFLAGILEEELKGVDWSIGWKYIVKANDIGVILELEAPGKLFFRTAFKSIGDGNLDLNAVQNFVVRAENTVDRIEKRDIQQDGIIVPNG